MSCKDVKWPSQDALDSVFDISEGSLLVGRVVESLGNSHDVVNRIQFSTEGMFVLPEYVISLCKSLML